MLSSFSLPLTPPPSCALYRSSYKGTTLAAGIRRRRPAPLVQPAIVSVGREEDISIPLSDRNASRSIVSPSAYICLSAQRIFMSARRHYYWEREREREQEFSFSLWVNYRRTECTRVDGNEASIYDRNLELDDSVKQWKIRVLAMAWNRKLFTRSDKFKMDSVIV